MSVTRKEEEPSEIYRIQVASLSRREAAEAMGRELSEKFALPVIVRQNPDTGRHQVRLGAFASRGEAQSFATGTIAVAGYLGTLVVKETVASGKGEPTLALRGQNLFRVSSTGYLFLPASGNAFLRLDGKAYRGFLDVNLNRNGLITVVNQLGIEEYLLGVVPAELSPTSYPEFAALAAQAVAARTYGLKNMGRFSSEGFDLTADPRSQVYGGVAQERDAASEAVRTTSGVVIQYRGNLIDAMYTSTCGGRTEDYSNVFDGPPIPYLRSVPCTAESSAGGSQETVLVGNHILEETFFADDGSAANRDLEFAHVIGLTGQERLSPEYLRQSPTTDEIRKWVDKARNLAGKTAASEPAAAGELTSRGGFVRYAAEHIFGAAEIQRRITAKDADYYLSNLKDGAQVPASARNAFSFLIQSGLWRPYPDNSIRPHDAIRRAEALSLLLRWVENTRPEILRTGVFAGSRSPAAGEKTDKSIEVKWGNRVQRLPLTEEVRLFSVAGGHSNPAGDMRLIGNEKLKFHLGRDGRIDFLEIELNPAGASSDRFSPAAAWHITLTRSAVAERLRPLAGDIGAIEDIKPSNVGNSGRAVQIQVVGSRGSVQLNGYKVRNALGLKDTLFTIQRTQDPSGSVESFVFKGRGWGHGVGLCQVGAYGMARAGHGYEEILKTYYQGVELRKAY